MAGNNRLSKMQWNCGLLVYIKRRTKLRNSETRLKFALSTAESILYKQTVIYASGICALREKYSGA
jgi:hypothetical protein